jgi:ubiquinone/menaquinone biosynthesis C-methylase UbiE
MFPHWQTRAKGEKESMEAPNAALNLRTYNKADVAAHYAGMSYLTPCERLLFETYIKPGMTILDLGVGGGRTTSWLASIASRYVGIDYSEAMVQQCRSRFPHLEFLVADASDLSVFPSASFDAAVMAFNAIDYIVPDEARARFLKECLRVLRPGGVFIFSSHNPRAIFARPSWNPERLRVLTLKLTGDASGFFKSVLFCATCARMSLAWLTASAASLRRILFRVTKSPFWRGEGWMFDPAHGGLMMHCGTPESVTSELQLLSFQLRDIRGDDYPKRSRSYITDWYYYVFAKPDRPADRQPCA